MNNQSYSGFTLIELIVSIGIIATLFTIVLIAINPARQFSLANNTKRKSDVHAILNAVQQYIVANGGVLPAGITTSVQTIAKSSGIDMCADLVRTYIAAFPVDPLTNNGTTITDCSSAYSTNYMIVRGAADNRITVSAPAAELGVVITVTQ